MELENEEMVDINIDCKGEILPQKNGKIALIDADTVIFATCSTLAVTDDLLPESFYTTDEWEEITSDPGYSERNNTLSFLNIEDALTHSKEKIDFILQRTGCVDFELHFTIGRKSFPYAVSKDYKANRLGKPTPYGIMLLKEKFHSLYPDKVYMNTEWEADHIVVCKKRDFPDKYILVAVDKDVLYTLEGKHFNYYQSTLYNIDMKWVTVTKDEAMRRYYIQTLTGDTGDNVIGLKGIGPKKAEKALKHCTTPEECWDVVVAMYEKSGRDIIDAITNMRLVDMTQLELIDNEYKVKLWRP